MFQNLATYLILKHKLLFNPSLFTRQLLIEAMHESKRVCVLRYSGSFGSLKIPPRQGGSTTDYWGWCSSPSYSADTLLAKLWHWLVPPHLLWGRCKMHHGWPLLTSEEWGWGQRGRMSIRSILITLFTLATMWGEELGFSWSLGSAHHKEIEKGECGLPHLLPLLSDLLPVVGEMTWSGFGKT